MAARTLLELGAELISSDGIALYELIKNSVDAGTKHVDVRVNVTLTHTNFLMALERVTRENQTLEDAKEWILNRVEESAPDELRKKFEKQIKGVKSLNALENTLVEAYDEFNWIEVEDTGHGMSLNDLDEIYLTIGTRSRRKQKQFMDSDEFVFDEDWEPDQVLLGDKGIGRLSSMRLGERLEVVSTTSGEAYFNLLEVDWEDFSHDIDKLVHEIEIVPKRGKRKKDKTHQGTRVTVRGLKEDWTARRFQSIIHSDFARLVDPFEPRRGNRLLQLYYNGERHYIPEIPKKLLENAHAWGKARFYKDNKTKQIVFSGEVAYPLQGDWKKVFRLEKPELESLIQGLKFGLSDELPLSAIERLGPFQVQFYWYNRRILTEIAGLGTRRDVQDEVRQWGGGLMVFRDGFRVNPYGGPDDDWLELDKKALAAKAYKVNRAQIIGRVSISWRNKFLVDQTNREGFVDSIQKRALNRLLRHFLITEFRPFLGNVDAELKAEAAEDLDSIEERIEKAKTEIEGRILRLIRDVPEEGEALSELQKLIGQMSTYVDQAKEAAQMFEDDRAKFVYLAGIGLMVEFILHELGRASSHALGILQDVNRQQIPKQELSTLVSLADQLKTLQKRVDTLDPLSTSRRQRKETFNLFEAISQLIDSHGGEISRHNIRVQGNFDEEQAWKVKAVKGMFIQIIENLLANTFYWLKLQAKTDEKFRPRLLIELDPNEKTITFTDNGPGVLREDAENIFNAFFTRKPPGEGKGLGLYISREIAQYHDWELYVLDAPKRKTGRLNTFILDLG